MATINKFQVEVSNKDTEINTLQNIIVNHNKDLKDLEIEYMNKFETNKMYMINQNMLYLGAYIYYIILIYMHI